MGKVDYSLFRFLPTLAEAKKIFSPQNGDSTLNLYTQVLLRPSEAYFQITNFNQNYYFTEATGMFVVDCAGNELADVTEDTDFIVFNDLDGFSQIAYEVGFLDFDFFARPVHLKIVTDTYEFYSSPVTISNQFDNEYVRVEYLYYGMSFELGIDFSNAPIAGKFLTIGLRASYKDIEVKRTDKGYTQMSTALEVTSKVLNTPFFKFKIEYSSPFSYLQSAPIFSADVINIGWGEYLPQLFRVSNKPAQDAGEVLGSSNLKENEFACCLDLGETKIWRPQLLPAFTVIERNPVPDLSQTQQYYTVESFAEAAGNLAYLKMNRDIAPTSLTPAYNFKLFKDGALILTIPSSGFAIDGESYMEVSGDTLSLVIQDGYFATNGTFDFVVQPLDDLFGTQWEGYNVNELRVILADGEFDQDDFEPTEFLTDAI